MKVSVIVCTRDRPQYLQRSLPSIVDNDYPDLEVIVIDQSSDGDSAQVGAVTAQSDWRFRYERQDTVVKSKALNRALSLAAGEVLLYTDDDCTVPTDWVKGSGETLEKEPSAGIIFGALFAREIDSSKSYIPTFRPERYRGFRGHLSFMRVPKDGRSRQYGRGASRIRPDQWFRRVPRCRGGFRSADEWDMALSSTEGRLRRCPRSRERCDALG